MYSISSASNMEAMSFSTACSSSCASAAARSRAATYESMPRMCFPTRGKAQGGRRGGDLVRQGGGAAGVTNRWRSGHGQRPRRGAARGARGSHAWRERTVLLREVGAEQRLKLGHWASTFASVLRLKLAKQSHRFPPVEHVQAARLRRRLEQHTRLGRRAGRRYPGRRLRCHRFPRSRWFRPYSSPLHLLSISLGWHDVGRRRLRGRRGQPASGTGAW